jgi:polysaccharide biosynthesis transport protein
MNLNEILQILWRRKLLVLLQVVIVVAAAVLGLRLITPIYESTSTVAISPIADSDTTVIFSYFGNMDVIVPIYADAARSPTTHRRALERTNGLGADVSVDTYSGTPIMRIRARHADPERASRFAQAVTDALMARTTEGDVGIPGLRMRQVDRPAVAADPVFPRPNLTIGVALLLGLAFGVAAALLRENLTTRIETREVLSRVAGVPCFGEIPSESSVAKITSPEDLTKDPRLRVVAEAFRDIRTNLLFSERNLSSVVVTSPTGSHGKTSVAVGLAVTLAATGSRTVLVDADLRKGRLAEMLSLQRAPGLMEALHGVPLSETVTATEVENLDILTGGNLFGDPGELLLAEFPQLLAELESTYDTVVIDTTPLGPVNDARIVARYAKAALIVASAEATTRRQLHTAVERLTMIGVRPTAVVLNKAKREREAEYGYLNTPVTLPSAEIATTETRRQRRRRKKSAL